MLFAVCSLTGDFRRQNEKATKKPPVFTNGFVLYTPPSGGWGAHTLISTSTPLGNSSFIKASTVFEFEL
jgi:hypothetical protein